MKFTIDTNESFIAKVRGVDLPVDVAALPAVSLTKVFEYGLQRILNDAAASAKSDTDALALGQKRLDNLLSGVLRASPVREGNPIRARAMELALATITANSKFVAWVAKEGLKRSDKVAVAKARELAKAAIDVPENVFLAQAAKDVEIMKGLDIDVTEDMFDLEENEAEAA